MKTDIFIDKMTLSYRKIDKLRSLTKHSQVIGKFVISNWRAIEKRDIRCTVYRNLIKQEILELGVVFNGIKLDWRYTFRFFFLFFFSAMSSPTCHHPSWTWAVALPRFPPTLRIESTRVADIRRLDLSPPLIREIFRAANARCSRRLTEMWPDLLTSV